jgi:hypothetical protein
MGKIGPNQDQIARAIVSDAVPDKPLPRAVDDQRQFEFRMVVPIEGEAWVRAFKSHDAGIL